MIIDYTVAVECENPEVYYICRQCGKCGRKFENGFMIDDGGTTIDEEEQRQVRRMDREKAIRILTLFREEWDRHSKTPNAKALDMAIEALQEPEIVHCKDCKHWDKEIMYCNHTGMQIEPDGYCVYGERKE